MNFTVQYDDDNWNSFRASAWAQNSLLIPSSSFVSSGWNSSLSPWDSPLRFSLLSVDSRVRVGSGNSYSLPDIFAEPSATRNINYPSFLGVIKTSFAFSLSGYIFWCVSLFPILQFQQSEYIIPKILTANKACPRRIHHIFVHFDISRLPGGLGHLADSNSITQNPTTAYHPIQIAKKRLMSLLWFDVQLVLQFRLSLIDEVWLLDDSMMMLHNICQILMNCTYE